MRKALGESPNERRYIVTIPGRGYRFAADVEELDGEGQNVIVERYAKSTILIQQQEPSPGDASRVLRARRLLPGALKVIPASLIILAVIILLGSGLWLWLSRRSARQLPQMPIKSLAVLPFANGSDDPNLEYLTDGLSESLIDRLSQLPGVKVIARGSSFKYKGQEVDPQDVARALGVQALVLGRVVQRGDSLELRAELVDAREMTQLWGEHYNRKSADIQAVQEEIARTIAEKLRVRLTGAEEQQLTKRATENPEAYQLYLNGLFYRRKGGLENVRKALDYYNQAVALDPHFALAFAEMANAYNALNSSGVLDPKEATAKVRTAVQEALELDERLAEAHIELANLKFFVEWDGAGAEREYKRAIELNPNMAWARYSYGVYLTAMERHTEALAEIKRAQELDPVGVFFRGRRDGRYSMRAGTMRLSKNCGRSSS